MGFVLPAFAWIWPSVLVELTPVVRLCDLYNSSKSLRLLLFFSNIVFLPCLMLSFVDVSVNVYLKICPSRGWPPVGLKRNKGLLALAVHSRLIYR